MYNEIKQELKEAVQTIENIKNIENIKEVINIIVQCYLNDGKVVVFGNGGSAADSQHVVTELVGRFAKERRGLPAIALTVNTSILTALANDYDFKDVYSRQVAVWVKSKDVVLAISTSGNSLNIIEGVKKAKELGAQTIGFTGDDGGKLKDYVDICIKIPSNKCWHIQEGHIVVLHLICKFVEEILYNKGKL